MVKHNNKSIAWMLRLRVNLGVIAQIMVRRLKFTSCCELYEIAFIKSVIQGLYMLFRPPRFIALTFAANKYLYRGQHVSSDYYPEGHSSVIENCYRVCRFFVVLVLMGGFQRHRVLKLVQFVREMFPHKVLIK